MSHIRFSNFITGRVAVLEAELEAQLAAKRASEIAQATERARVAALNEHAAAVAGHMILS